MVTEVKFLQIDTPTWEIITMIPKQFFFLQGWKQKVRVSRQMEPTVPMGPMEKNFWQAFFKSWTLSTEVSCMRDPARSSSRGEQFVWDCVPHVFTRGEHNLVWKWAQPLAHGCFFISGTSLVTAQSDLHFIGLVSRNRYFKYMKRLSKFSLKTCNFSFSLLGFFLGGGSSL